MNGFGKAFGIFDRCHIDLAEVPRTIEREIGVTLAVGTQTLNIYLTDRER